MYIEVNSDLDLIDKDWYPKQLSKYDKQRNKILANCTHDKWSKTCAICKKVITSESTDWVELEYHKLKRDYEFIEQILIKIIYAKDN